MRVTLEPSSSSCRWSTASCANWRPNASREKPGQTLQATALVHEAYLRLVGTDRDRRWDGRGHFFAAAAEAVRRILIDRARDRKRLKRGGGRPRERLDLDSIVCDDATPDDLLDLDGAITRLAAVDRARPSWSSSASSPACRSKTRPSRWTSAVAPRGATGPSHGPGCSSNFRHRTRFENSLSDPLPERSIIKWGDHSRCAHAVLCWRVRVHGAAETRLEGDLLRGPGTRPRPRSNRLSGPGLRQRSGTSRPG